jgi:glycosyltransferase involved in cell wall biosynthesis
MRIAYVIDAKYSALGIAAQSRARINPDITIIEGLNYFSPQRITNALIDGGFELVIFSWRFLAADLFSFKYLRNSIIELGSKSSIAVVIPDHMGEDVAMQSREDLLLQHVDYFLVTNKLLFNHYSKRYPEKCKGVLHDIPDLVLIQAERSRVRDRRNDVIWVGNSTWGNRAGFKDFKGYFRIVVPLITRGFNVKVIDSAKQRLSNTDVLRNINESKALIQCSIEEGTGLPLLEAMGLGVVPITTKVGVAEELLTDTLSPLLVGHDVDEFAHIIEWARSNSGWIESNIKENFDKYCTDAKEESIFFESTPCSHLLEQSTKNDFFRRVKWVVRFCKFKLQSS